MTSIFELNGLLKAARDEMRATHGVLLDKNCLELFCFRDEFGRIIEQIERDNDSITIVIGLHAVSYYLAGVAKSIAKVAQQVSMFVNPKRRRLPKKNIPQGYKPILLKLIEYQEFMAEFGVTVRRECFNEASHISSQLMVMLEHPYVVQSEAVRKQLNNQLELIEDFLERLGSVVDQFEHHPLLKIDARLIHDGLAH